MTQPLLKVHGDAEANYESVADHNLNEFEEQESQRRRRADWRENLVVAEKGLSHGFRADSTLYVHCFVDCLLLATCAVIGLSKTHWAVLIAGMTAMASAEFFSRAILIVANELSPSVQKQSESACAAARLIVYLGCSLTIGIILWQRFQEVLFWI